MEEKQTIVTGQLDSKCLNITKIASLFDFLSQTVTDEILKKILCTIHSHSSFSVSQTGTNMLRIKLEWPVVDAERSKKKISTISFYMKYQFVYQTSEWDSSKAPTLI